MNNIPVFLAAGGTAALVLKEIPHRAVGYVQLKTIRDLPSLVAECAAFCRGCGAETVYVSQGPEPLPGLVHSHDILMLRVEKPALPEPLGQLELIPMTPENDGIYQRLYNQCFQRVTGAATYDRSQIQRIYRQNQQAFLALDGTGTPVGMGELHENELAAIGLLPAYRSRGWSRDLCLQLLSRCPGPEITLTTVSDNEAALGLYDSLGFTVCGKDSMWYYG